MLLPEYQGLRVPRTLCTSILPTPHPGGGSAGLSLQHRQGKAVCKQASSASLRDVHAGPWKEGTLGPARDKREGHRCGRRPDDLHVPGRAGTQARLRASRRLGA